MTNPRLPVCLLMCASLLAVCVKTDAQKLATSSPNAPEFISLNFMNNGQHISATVGQQIEITLGTVGPAQYGKPEVSSTAVRLQSVALRWPANPGGPTFTYIFEAAAEGQVLVKVPIINSDNPDWTKQHTFAAMLHVGPAAGNPQKLHAFLTPDQSNTEPWKSAWTNLHNAQQSFVPSLPRLTGVEVELVIANPGPASDEVTMTLTNVKGAGLAVVSKTVMAGDCSHVLFVFPNGGLRISPGHVHNIVLNSNSGVFGWKYVSDGYPEGVASLNGKPLSRDAHRAFLFRTFGAN